VDAIRLGQAPFYEPGLSELLQSGAADSRLQAFASLSEAPADADILMLAVGTPLRSGAIDLAQIENAAAECGRYLRAASGYCAVVVKSTVIPGTADGLVKNLLERESGKRLGADFGLASNPEFLREGEAVADFMNPDRIVIGGWDARSSAQAASLYAAFRCPQVLTSLRNAEMIKYASNAFLAMLVSFSNEIAGICEQLPGLDCDTVLHGLRLDRRLSPQAAGQSIQPGFLAYLHAGVGYGGSCLPKDIAALRGLAQGLNIPSPLLDAVAQVNESRFGKIIQLLRHALGGELAGKAIAVLGLAFKPNTDDLRDSPALRLVDGLLAGQARVRALDPMIRADALLPYAGKISLAHTPEDLLRGADAAVLATAWPEFGQWDWPRLATLMAQPIIVDGRNALKHLPWPASIRYLPIGAAPAAYCHD
jgi:UDPglucose 6-dehydrogenase/GDP-mannose 6-dehydrogenase